MGAMVNGLMTVLTRLSHGLVTGVLLVLSGGTPAAAFDVQFAGQIDEKLASELRGGSLLVEQSRAETPPSTLDLVSAAQADYQRLLAVLYENGHFAPVIEIWLDGREAADIPAVSPPLSIERATIRIAPGELFTFGKAVIGPLAPETDLPQGFAEGTTAGLSILRETVAAGVDGWRDQGHAKAVLVAQNLIANHRNHSLSADLQLKPGPRYRFGSLIIAGNDAVRRERIEEIAGFPEGQVFSPQELDRVAARLRRSGAFRSVALQEAEAGGADDTLPITAQLSEAKPRRFGLGIEASTVEGLSLNAFWLHRNYLGGAERLRLEGEIKGIGGETGGTDARLTTRFERPATLSADTDLYVLGEIAQLDEVRFFSRQATAEFGFERIASEQRRYRYGLGLRHAQTRSALGENDYTLLQLPLGATFDYRDVPLDARDGSFIDLGLTPFLGLNGADHGLRTVLDARLFRSLDERRNATLALRGQLGTVMGPTLRETPVDYLFYSGGGGTVRGQGFQSLGVDLGGDQLIGGRSFIGLSAELRLRGSGNLGYVGFADAGYVGAETFPDGSGVWHSGAGLGLRYNTGIGPLRLDLAVPVTGRDENNSFQLYIGIGQAF